jgi:hypothetical protein
MEAAHAWNLDTITLAKLVIFNQAGRQAGCATGISTSAKENPATE